MNVANHYKNPKPDEATWHSFIQAGQEVAAENATKQQHNRKSNGQYKQRPFVLYSELEATSSKS